MKIVIFGLAVSSSWGNGHATLWRGLCRSLAYLGHAVVFFERDVPYYASHRDLFMLPGGGDLVLYGDWAGIAATARRHLGEADVAIVTSYCPDALAATDLLLESRVSRRVFYDLDAPVTLDHLRRGEDVAYLGPRGLRDFDLVLSYTGGPALAELRDRLGARRVAPLYGSVDPDVHRAAPPDDRYRADLSYLGTHAPDRDAALRALFVEPARLLPDRRFVIGGSMYDGSFPWQPNIYFVAHVPPADHPAFYSSSVLTLNVTRRAMAIMGYCPSGRLFEAAACGAPVLSDYWPGLETFFEPGREILLGHTTEDAMDALNRSPEDLARLARAARERTLAEHTSDARAAELERILEGRHTVAKEAG
jgi:spore maturation protein CgeB